ncbi:diaminopimelate epimerase [Actinophytocola sediminis]
MHIPFVKGHGTENDFVLLPDPESALDLTPARVRAVCDRRAGLGADGVLRVVRAEGTWFMDYRNADGSVAEMCGNGVRVFARYLLDEGLVSTREFTIGTRAGERGVRIDDRGAVTVDMGRARVFGESVATIGERRFPGVAVDVGNPHLVCRVDRLDDLDLSAPPVHDRMIFPDGVNVEFVVVEAPDRIRLRVHERGVGETRSCGTGTVAAVAGILHGAGHQSGAADVHIPGGRVHVVVGDDTCTLTGPAVFVARGEIDQSWWESVSE